MARTKRDVNPLPTIWRTPAELWDEVITPILRALDPPRATGRPRIDQRNALDGIIYHLRTGCQWNALPREFGSDSSVHRTFQRWVQNGILHEIWAALIDCCDELDGVEWEWQSADAAMGKARFGGMTSGRTPRIVPKTAQNAA